MKRSLLKYYLNKFMRETVVPFSIIATFLIVLAALLFMTIQNWIAVQELRVAQPDNIVEQKENLTENTTNDSHSRFDNYSLPARELKPDALMCWRFYIQEKYDRKGDLFSNRDMMRISEIPWDTVCSISTASSEWLPARFQKWIFTCNLTTNPEYFTTFATNGTAVIRLTGSIYYNSETNPLLMYGTGDYPAACYIETRRPTTNPIPNPDFDNEQNSVIPTPSTIITD